MYHNSASFVTSRDVSFSSYLNKAEETMIRKLANDHQYRMKPEDDEEIGVFGAEKYFNGEIEDEGDQQDQKGQEFDHNFTTKLRTGPTSMHTPSVRSNASCNSRSGLLPRANQSYKKIENGSKTRAFLARFGCNCMNKKSTTINEKKIIHTKQNTFDSDQKTDRFSSNLEEKKPRNECFSFPVLNPNDLNSNSSSNSKPGNWAGKVVKVDDNITGSLSLGKKLSLLNDWDMDNIPTEGEMYNPSSRMYNHGFDSDSSSDLFEIESFSPTGGSSCVGQRKSNCYAPSEVSIEWSVVTASAADFSVVSDYEDVGTGGGGWRNDGRNAQCTDNKDERKKRSGILSGCTSHKVVRVARNGYKVSGGIFGGGII